MSTATSVDLVTRGRGTPPADRTQVLLEVLASVREAYEAWQAGGEAGAWRLRESYGAACTTVGRRVRVDLPDGTVLDGRASGVDDEGRLLVVPEGTAATGESESRAVSVGDVVHVRAVG